MGLTIHYSLQSHARTADDAGELVRQLRQRATALPFDVSDVVDLVGSACDFQQTARDDPNRWLLVQAGRHVEVEADGNTYLLAPRRLIAFTTRPGQGCEPANFGLCRYPRTLHTRDHRNVPTGVPAGWSWQSFCKTQYASNPNLGGVESFVHITGPHG